MLQARLKTKDLTSRQNASEKGQKIPTSSLKAVGLDGDSFVVGWLLLDFSPYVFSRLANVWGPIFWEGFFLGNRAGLLEIYRTSLYYGFWAEWTHLCVCVCVYMCNV